MAKASNDGRDAIATALLGLGAPWHAGLVLAHLHTHGPTTMPDLRGSIHADARSITLAAQWIDTMFPGAIRRERVHTDKRGRPKILLTLTTSLDKVIQTLADARRDALAHDLQHAQALLE